MSSKHTNSLIRETSPYLLQHAHNPVNWEPWNTSSLERARKENKLLLVSIGYAACHWCHVMEHECFEDEEVAEVMNRHFVTIKIDREERPDIDHIYMDALQMMTGSGGWPLNIIALPDGRPFWGATFVKKPNWIQVLQQLANLYYNEPNKVMDYAQSLAEGIVSINLIENKTDNPLISLETLDTAVKNWTLAFDTFLGGYKRAPKFMMPNNLEFLLHYATSQKNAEILDYVTTSLTRMASGGIFDHVGGGFSRYAVDTKWHIPHFEKMLYDNGQLISLYSKAYTVTKNKRYKQVVEETIAFVTMELMSPEYAFYSSLDADSINQDGKLEEGAFYVWKEDQLKAILGANFNVFKDYFNINDYGYWEHGKYVLIMDASAEEIAKKHKIGVTELHNLLSECKALLNTERNKRVRPRLDDKILTSWNGLMLKGLIDAYKFIGTENYLHLALNNATFIEKSMIKADGGMFRNHKNGSSTLSAYLEDYAVVIDAFISLYEATFDEKWLTHSKKLTEYCLKNFFDEDSELFFFTSKEDDFIIRRTIETNDNVISSSNSVMAKNLFRLSRFFLEDVYETIALKMVVNIQDNFVKNAQAYANWLHLVLFKQTSFYEVVIVGDNYKEMGKEINSHYLPNSIILGAQKGSNLAQFKNRTTGNNTLIHVCQQGSCQLPESETEKVLSKMG